MKTDPRYPRNRALRPHRRLILFAMGAASYGAGLLLARTPALAETVYGSFLGPLLVRALAVLTGWASFSMGELLILAYLFFQLWVIWKAGRDVLRGRRSVGNALGSGVLRVARDVGVVVTLFYLLWGFNYSRPPLQHTLGWEFPDSASVDEVAGLIEELILAANDEYRLIHGVEDAGVPTALPRGRDSTVVALTDGWLLARRSLGFPERAQPSGRVKTPLLSPWYEWVGVAGFYFPFTGEPNVRGGIPAMDAGKILAHELAHQRGVAGEAEANFWGFLTAALAWDPVARYSAYVFAQQQLMNTLSRGAGDRDAYRERARSLRELRLPGVQRDIQASYEYWASHRGRGTRVGSAVNDAYLRTNRVEGGVRDYSRSTLLLLAYARERGGRIVP